MIEWLINNLFRCINLFQSIYYIVQFFNYLFRIQITWLYPDFHIVITFSNNSIDDWFDLHNKYQE